MDEFTTLLKHHESIKAFINVTFFVSIVLIALICWALNNIMRKLDEIHKKVCDGKENQ